MITGKLSSGYKFSVDETVTDEWDFVKAIGLCESKNVAESVYGMTIRKNKCPLLQII